MTVGVGLVAWRIGKTWTRWHTPWAGFAQPLPHQRGALLWTRCGREIPTKGLVSWSSDIGAEVGPNETCRTCLERMAFHPEEVA